MSIPKNLRSSGYLLDLDIEAFGELASTKVEMLSAKQLQQQMATDGYLYLPKFLEASLVQKVRTEVATVLAQEGSLDISYPLEDCVAKLGVEMSFRPDIALQSSSLNRLLYQGKIIDFFQNFLEGEIRHFDYTWLRATTYSIGTPPHTDSVYMGRGTEQVYTVWVPLGNVPWELGGLIILEDSHLIENIISGYAKKDVDRYCINRINSELSGAGRKGWSGALTKNPRSLRARYGGRWLGANFQMGDVVIFSIFTVHASLDNQSPYIRLSTDSRYQLAIEPVDHRWVGDSPLRHSLAAKLGVIC